ncbi:MAG TPA: twin-arginine translocase subunit TatC [Dehalococcoidia bacterium]|nr:twin-arginine translocase subunit TatC [Dehalococcoidia bacterium]
MTTSAPPINQRTAEEGKMMTIIEHLMELRTRLMIAVLALVAGVAVSIWPLTGWTIDFLVQPADHKYPGFTLAQFTLLDYWSTYFRVSLLLGLALAMPVIMYQVLAFIAPGLTPEERRWLFPIVFGCAGMFIGGMAFAYYVTLPPALDFLLDPASENVEPVIGVQSYIDTVTRLLFLTGLTFQLPFVIMALAKIGVVTSGKLIRWWRVSILLSVVAAAIVTPSIDPVTQAIVAVPIMVLYCLGIVLARLVEANSFLASRRNF